jgi:hypothetical protein
LAAEYRAKLGATASEREIAGDIVRASELQALAEAERARHIRGQPTMSTDHLVRLEGLAARSVKALRLPETSAQPPRPTLAEFLARRKAAGAISDQGAQVQPAPIERMAESRSQNGEASE